MFNPLALRPRRRAMMSAGIGCCLAMAACVPKMTDIRTTQQPDWSGRRVCNLSFRLEGSQCRLWRIVLIQKTDFEIVPINELNIPANVNTCKALSATLQNFIESSQTMTISEPKKEHPPEGKNYHYQLAVRGENFLSTYSYDDNQGVRLLRKIVMANGPHDDPLWSDFFEISDENGKKLYETPVNAKYTVGDLCNPAIPQAQIDLK